MTFCNAAAAELFPDVSIARWCPGSRANLEFSADLETTLNLKTVEKSLIYCFFLKVGTDASSINLNLARANQTFDGSGLKVDGSHLTCLLFVEELNAFVVRHFDMLCINGIELAFNSRMKSHALCATVGGGGVLNKQVTLVMSLLSLETVLLMACCFFE